MATTLDSIAGDALDLPIDQRLTLARRLLESVDIQPDPGASAAWQAELALRIERLDAGETEAVPAAEAFDRLRKIAPSS